MSQKIKKIVGIITSPQKIFWNLARYGFFRWLPEVTYIKLAYRVMIGGKLDLKNPVTYNQKLQWLKLYDRKPEYTTMVDKYEAKKYVADKIGEEHIIPTYGVWDRFEDIDFNKLPNQFVLKVTHDSGGVVICRDKETFDINAAKRKLKGSLRRSFYWVGREWPYKNVKPRIIAEKYMCDNSERELVDYKFFCFNGKPEIMYLSRDTAENPGTDFYDMDFNLLALRMRDQNSGCSNERPECFEEMKELARILSEGLRHIRVDFYYVNGCIYMGELTFYHCSGLAPVRPDEWNIKLGAMINID